jgi:RNase P subunit RPR2
MLQSNLAFINDAAHILRTSAPETSAYLMSHHSNLASAGGIELPESQRQHACNACGHIMVPGQGSELKLEAATRRRRVHQRQKKTGRPSKATPAPAKTQLLLPPRKTIHCGLCHEVTVIKLPQAPAPSRRKIRGRGGKPETDRPGPGPASARVVSEPPTTATAVKAAANASSKKRAKNRKAGLQALLSQNSQGTRSLSLADLARK